MRDGHRPVGCKDHATAFEKRLILATLDHCGRDKSKTANMLGISLKTLYNRLERYRTEGTGRS